VKDDTHVSPAPLIEFKEVVKVYGRGHAAVRALDGVDLQVRAGEFIAIMGPSGSGKSTAMNILGCLDTPSTGRYLFTGTDVSRLTRDQRAMLRRHFLGFVFQGYNLLARTSAIRNVELPLIYRGLGQAERRRQAHDTLARVGLKDWAEHAPSELSGGQQQRVAIARAIVTRPYVLLADEPTGNLDTARGLEIMTLISRLNAEEGLTVVMVTHERDMAAFAGRIVHFLDGRIEPDAERPGEP